MAEASVLEAVLPEAAIAIGRAVWQLETYGTGLAPTDRLSAAAVEAVDLALRDVESALDQLRRALVARQTGRD